MKSEISIKAAIFLRAAELMDKHGLCKYNATNDAGNICAIHAILEAQRELDIKLTGAELHCMNWVFYTALPEITTAHVTAKLREKAFEV